MMIDPVLGSMGASLLQLPPLTPLRPTPTPTPSAIGVFYEGCIVQGYTTDAADDAVQANIVAAGYKVGIV